MNARPKNPSGLEGVFGLASNGWFPLGTVLASPVLRQVLCQPTNFSFNPRSLVWARGLTGQELGEFDALVLGLLLIGHANG